ncbi:MAG TPA: TIGR00730 family Rossman fold protein [Anaerolineae bacterium]|nr:TIGR00730 family Rossman fold protein [Anaerolineae bacterium]
MKSICVYCSSSDAVDTAYFEVARELGAFIAACGCALVYGGARRGLMGTLARAVQGGGGRVVGVIPAALRDRGIAYDAADELIVTSDLRERKAIMEARADAFIALPGGFGTLEELLEVLTLRQLQTHTKPIVLLNVQGFYDPLMAVFEHFYRARFAKPVRDLYYLAPDVAGVFAYLDAYVPVAAPGKWFTSGERNS